MKNKVTQVNRFKFGTPMGDYQRAVQAFLKGETAKTIGKFHCEGNQLVYRTVVKEEFRLGRGDISSNRDMVKKLKKLHAAAIKGIVVLLGDWKPEDLLGDAERLSYSTIEYKKLASNVVARRLPNGEYIGNSSVLGLIGRIVAFGNEKMNRVETDVQRYLSQFVPMLPFSVFQEAKLDLNSMVIKDRGQAETVVRKVQKGWKGNRRVFKDETIHFTGASVFQVESKTFLFDIDRREVKHKIFNPFLVELPRQAGTVADAYASLIPVEVSKAIRKGLDVQRQGEWFFIPTKVTKAMLKGKKVFGMGADAKKDRWTRETLRLKAGDNRPNHAQIGFTDSKGAFVSGKIEHEGREHADLVLKGWFKAVPNTATKSFTITGDVD